MKFLKKLNFKINNFLINALVTGKWKQNSYLLTNETNGNQILIDPGNDGLDIIELIKKNGNGTIEKILLTHGHFDHVGALNHILNTFDVPVFIHKDDKRILHQTQFYSIKYEKKYNHINLNRISFFDNFNNKNVKILKALHSPGHTPGSVCYYSDGFVFTGDTLFNGFIGRTDLYGGNATLIKKSVDNILNTIPNKTTIFSGHGDIWDIVSAKAWWVKCRENDVQLRLKNDPNR